MANQPDIMVVDKKQRRAAVTDVANPADGNISKSTRGSEFQSEVSGTEIIWNTSMIFTGCITAMPTMIGKFK